jgi:hypothetical protein
MFACATVAHAASFPTKSFWEHKLFLLLYLATGVVTAARQTVIYIDRRNRKRNSALDDACRRIAAYIDQTCPNIVLRDLGVHVWILAGPWFAQRLERAASFLIRDRRRSAVSWTKGKGVFGLCWEERAPVIVDLETELYAKAPTRAAFEALPQKERLGLEWDELQRTRHYKTVYAAPLFDRDAAKPSIRGIVAVDILTDGHFDELAATVGKTEFNAILGICEGVLIG